MNPGDSRERDGVEVSNVCINITRLTIVIFFFNKQAVIIIIISYIEIDSPSY